MPFFCFDERSARYELLYTGNLVALNGSTRHAIRYRPHSELNNSFVSGGVFGGSETDGVSTDRTAPEGFENIN